MIELVVFRGVACNAPYSKLLLEWITGVIQQACRERRDVRVSVLLSHSSSTLIKILII